MNFRKTLLSLGLVLAYLGLAALPATAETVSVYALAGDQLTVNLSTNSWDSGGKKNYNLQSADQGVLAQGLKAGDTVTIDIAGTSSIDIPTGLQVMIDDSSWSNVFSWDNSQVSVDDKGAAAPIKAGVAFARTFSVKLEKSVGAGKGIVCLLTAGGTTKPTPAVLTLSRFTITK